MLPMSIQVITCWRTGLFSPISTLLVRLLLFLILLMHFPFRHFFHIDEKILLRVKRALESMTPESLRSITQVSLICKLVRSPPFPYLTLPFSLADFQANAD